ncbi:histone deacetylase complex subunit SAP18-like [Spinacia oleracea]|uniref:Histone deacetylase complex subunit SAP18-like n=1 Tax=Spinacia oleracea TaxID=3562 RepID=A0ABM3QWH1_SPIOL|nr:histone deacetylase complex subunit SAP18-like [Spinacia oleracea]XP_056691566.1 histone deacetylase complex subunit SAP18-like [Spinacia oleracea]XP_056695938.1 histone deacetylase complex subunit SAP18-like [Spinacia oleracea]
MDATLREMTDLVKEVSPAARRRDAKLSFAVVYPDKNGRMQVKKVYTPRNAPYASEEIDVVREQWAKFFTSKYLLLA